LFTAVCNHVAVDESPDWSTIATRARRALTVPLVDSLDARLLDEADPAAGAWFVANGLAGDGAGGLYAAALTAVLELAAHLALLPRLAGTERVTTDAVATQMTGAARDGDRVAARGAVDRRTRRLGLVSVVATTGERLIARAQLTMSIVEVHKPSVSSYSRRGV
jgi:acyl-coenzyme A thioesterase PaaI-like protein